MDLLATIPVSLICRSYRLMADEGENKRVD